MWHVMAVIGYFVLALLIPIGFTAVGIWAKTRQARVVSCPQAGASAAIWLDPWFAMRKRAIGDPEEPRLKTAREIAAAGVLVAALGSGGVTLIVLSWKFFELLGWRL